MVCIAAFIILILVGIIVAFLSIFNRDLGKKYLKVLKKSWHCFSRRITFRKCDTKFSDDVKNILLKKVVIKKPKLVKPISVTIEIASIAIVVLTAWSLIEAAKAGLALWVFGTCNVSQPANCALGAESCAIDETDLNWFTEWGEIFAAIPDKFHTYNADDYDLSYITASSDQVTDAPVAIDIFDPGCSVCMISYRNQKSSGFFDNYNVRLVPFAIQAPDDTYKFKNSELIVRYMLAATEINPDLSLSIIDRIFTGKNHDGISYQTLFNEDYDYDTAKAKLIGWLKADDATDKDIKTITENAYSSTITDQLAKNRDIVEHQIKVKGIPTMLYDGIKHTGLYKKD